ncbi:hypothetical protein OOK43_23255 [[Kitasatospora] papulosa]|uniref:hypothetical protein n=1 Tax=[Kitasatospora] papulosa TaxID=1464011 RepID=UPI00224D7A83|nr:hypothetical protein [[Kitasatospora] papulosa]MCX4416178.1 hypothetical protein [[Kitasatospora] papulosa]
MLERDSIPAARLVRFFITLPEPLAIPDGYTWHKKFDHDPSAESIQQFVNLVFMQSDGMSRQGGALSATFEALSRAKGEPQKDDTLDAADLTGQYTTVMATTLDVKAPDAEAQWGRAQDVPPEIDPFNRCVEEIARFTRSYRAALEAPCLIPTYEKIGPFIPYQMGDFIPVKSEDGEGTGFKVSNWGEGGSMLLDHLNMSDFPAGDQIKPEDAGRIDFYMNMLTQGNPLFLWKERFVEARTALYREGKYGTAVTLSNTASEVLLDGLLSALYWESKKRPEEVAGIFAEGRLARRVKSSFSELLGGNWSLDGTGPVANWFHKCYRLRHRVVHGGYSPTRLEAQTAIDVTLALADYCWDRLVAKKKKFPRVVLMVIAEEGLRKRDKWCHFMRNFVRDVAPVEPSWLDASDAWRSEMYDALLSGD